MACLRDSLSLSSLDPDAGLSRELKIPSLPEPTYLLQEEEEEQRGFLRSISLSPAAQEKFFLPAQSHLFLVGRREDRKKAPSSSNTAYFPFPPSRPEAEKGLRVALC